MIALDHLPVAALTVASDGTVVGANPAAVELLGGIEPQGRALATCLAGVVLDSAEPQRSILTGSSRELRVTVGPEVGDRRVVVLYEPSTDPTAAQTISLVSHELRSPLTSLRGFVGLLMTRWDRIDEAERGEILGQIDLDAQRVARLLTELLDLTRLDAGGVRLRRDRIPLGPVVHGVVDRTRLTAPDLSCTVDLDPALPEVFADAGRLEQILVNLLENAAKYGSIDGAAEVSVVARADDAAVRIEVADRGPGVATSERERVFDRFFRHDDGRPDGLGLGLFISRAFAEAHGGSLELAANDGPGARFCLTLPLVSSDALPS